MNRNNIEPIAKPSGLAIVTLIIGNGLAEATFGSRVMDLESALGTTPTGISLAIASFTAGLLFGSLIYRRLLATRGRRACLLLGVPLFFVPLPLLGAIVLLPHAVAFPLTVALWSVAGTGCGLVDPTAVLHAADYAKATGNQDVQAFQSTGLFAVAFAAGFGWWAVNHEFPLWAHFTIIGLPTFALTMIAAARLPNGPGEDAPTDNRTTGPAITYRRLMLLGAMNAGVIVILGACLNWGSSYFIELGGGPLFAGLGTVVFAVFQGVMMLVSRAMTSRTSVMRAVAIGVSIAVAGCGLLGIVALGHALAGGSLVLLVIAAVGFALLGGGSAAIPGFVQQAVVNVSVGSMSVGQRLGTVVILQYTGQNLAPVALGLMVSSIGVTNGFAVLAGVCLLTLLLGWPLLRFAELRALAR
ncbi:MAG TPA: hypothetical protein VN635_10610 [Conexibacter sp.]|nr:hypothetical protein [Conexibacter sp.]